MWKSLPTDYCTRLISWLCNDFVTLTTIIDFQGVRKDWNCPPIPEKKSEKTQNLSFSVWLLTRLFFLPSTDHKTLFCWSVPLGLPQASFLQNWREEKKFRVAEIRLQKPKKYNYHSIHSMSKCSRLPTILHTEVVWSPVVILYYCMFR